MNTYNELIERFVSWAKTEATIKSVFIVGSHARADHPADQYSDLDLVMVVADPDYFISSAQWLNNIGNYMITFIERTAVGGGKERRVLFENALEVDFAVFSEEGFERVITKKEVQTVFKRGFRVLFDKIGLVNTLPQISAECQAYLPPEESDFINFVNDFWYHSVWATKKLQRGEIWAAKSCVDCYMKGQLLGIIECHAHAVNGWEYDTWHNGRFLDIWAEQRVKELLQSAFSHYDRNDIGRALLASMGLFRLLAVEAAEKMHFEYPNTVDESATKWVNNTLANLIKF